MAEQVDVRWQRNRNPVYQGEVHKIMLTPLHPQG